MVNTSARKRASRKWNKTHPDNVKIWRANNPEKFLAQRKRQRYASLVSAARKDNILVSISKDEYESVVSSPCFYCNGELPLKGYGIDRINSNIGYVQGNIRPCCTHCNRAKNDMTETQFKEWLLRIFNHWIDKV